LRQRSIPGYFYALDAWTGDVFWNAMIGGQVSAGPVTYGVARAQVCECSGGECGFHGSSQRRAFTPAVILFIALPEAKENIDPG